MTSDAGGYALAVHQAPYQVLARSADGRSGSFPAEPARALSQSLVAVGQHPDRARPHQSDGCLLVERQRRSRAACDSRPLPMFQPHRAACFYMTSRAVELEDVSGAVTTLSRPYRQRPRILYAGVNRTGVVIGDDSGHARYLRFSYPAVVHRLRTGAVRWCAMPCPRVRRLYDRRCPGAVGRPGRASAARRVSADQG